MSSLSLLNRLKACFIMSALNFSATLWPHIPKPYYGIVLITFLVLNAAVCLIILRGVAPTEDLDEDEKATDFAKRSVVWLGYSYAIIFLILGLLGRLDRQLIPFQLCGYAFFMVASRVMEISLDKWIDEWRDED